MERIRQKMNEAKSSDESIGYVRLALPLMSEYSIPVTPENYAVWYSYVSGKNEELRKTIELMIEESKQFSKEINEILYQRFFKGKDENSLREVQEGLQWILVTIFNEVTKLTGETGKCESLLNKSVDRLSGNISIEELRDIVNVIISETKSMGKAGWEMQQKLEKTKEDLKILQNEVAEAKTKSLVDFLTGIANRRGFDKMLLTSVDEIDASDDCLCLLLIDIDHFKKFNDLHGHIVGDEVLKFVAKKIKKTVRGRDLLARFGGEEFTVILPKTPLLGAKTVAENIRIAFAEGKLKRSTTSKDLGTITVSIGVSQHRSGESLEDFIKRSDQALYLAKESGRNRVMTESDLEKQNG